MEYLSGDVFLRKTQEFQKIKKGKPLCYPFPGSFQQIIIIIHNSNKHGNNN